MIITWLNWHALHYRLLQHENPALAAKYFLSTAEFLQLDDKFRESANAIKNAVRMYCRTRPRQWARINITTMCTSVYDYIRLDKIISTAQQSRRAFLEAGSINLAHEVISCLCNYYVHNIFLSGSYSGDHCYFTTRQFNACFRSTTRSLTVHITCY